MKKWYATINGDDQFANKKIKIGIVKKHDDDSNKDYFEIIASNGDDVGACKQETLEQAIDTIHGMWSSWQTFEWIE